MLTPALVLAATLQTPVSLVSNGSFASELGPEWKVNGLQVHRFIAGDDRPTLRISFSPTAGSDPGDFSMRQSNVAPVSADDVVLITASIKSDSYSRARFAFGKPGASPFFQETVPLSPVWKQVRVAGKVSESLPIGTAEVSLALGFGAGNIEVAGIEVENLGKSDLKQIQKTLGLYGAYKHDDSWRKAALARIEKIRKADLTVKVVDAAGKPVSNAQVRVDQVQHAFHFGTAVPSFRILGTSPDDEKYRRTLLEMFDTVTFENDMKWQRVGAPTNPRLDSAVDWLFSHHLRLRGHNLVWGSYRWSPRELRSASADEARRMIEDRVRTAVKTFKGKPYVWDVVNEAVSETELWDKVGWESFANAFKLARAEDPNVLLCYNDYNLTEEGQVGSGHLKKAIQRIQYLKDHGAPLDVIGTQGHVGPALTPPKRFLEILDELGRLALHLEVTEFDLGLTDDEAQAQHLRDLLTASFSHPQMDAFILWGFWEGAHWRANESAALIRRDWTSRPAAKAWLDLVRGQWWTKASGATGRRGDARFRPFLGIQRVTVTADGKEVVQTVEVKRGSGNQLVVQLPE